MNLFGLKRHKPLGTPTVTAPSDFGDELKLIKRDTSASVAAAKTRIGGFDQIKRRIGVIRLWPDQAVAEHENVERIRIAAGLLGIEIVELDRSGFILNSPKAKVTREDVDFVIHLHFETAKSYDVPSIAAMWNPVEFYFDWGFDTFWPNQMSHDMFASTGSEVIAGMIAQERGQHVAATMPLLNHTLAEPIYAPQLRESRQIFYCGINWEKITGKPGRHDVILRALDEAGVLAIYGPERVQGVNVWEGFQSYRGSLPFDGCTVIEKIARAGACLVFSSDAHKTSNIMSNRLFEALSGGAVVIGDEHPFIEQAIGEKFIKVPSNISDQDRVDIILRAVDSFQKSPQDALSMAQASQDLFMEKYFLCDQIANLYELHCSNRAGKQALVAKIHEPICDVIIQPILRSGNHILKSIQELEGKISQFANFILLCEPKYFDWYSRHCGPNITVAGVLTDESLLAPADALRAVKPHLKCRKVWFSTLSERLYPEQFASALVAFEARAVGRLGHLLCHRDESGTPHFDFRPGNMAVERFHDAARGSFIFDRDWLLENVVPSRVGWRDCVRMGEIAESSVACDQISAVEIDLPAFEAYIAAGGSEAAVKDGFYFSVRTSARRENLSDSASTSASVVELEATALGLEKVRFALDQIRVCAPLLGDGWHPIERSQVWSSGHEATLWIKIKPGGSQIDFAMAGNPHVPNGAQSVIIEVNGKESSRLVVKDGAQFGATVAINACAWRSGMLNKITVRCVDVAKPPVETGDERLLGVALLSLEVL